MADIAIGLGSFTETDVASAATCDIGAASTIKVRITGSVTITSLGAGTNRLRFIRFAAALTLTHNAVSLRLPTNADIPVEAGDTCFAMSTAAGNWVVVQYQRDTGLPLVSPLPVSAGGTGSTVVPFSPPQGRLTLTTAVPFLSADVSGAGTIYYTPAVGEQVPLYDGTRYIMTTFAELSQALTDNTKSPAAAAADSVYDLFVWNDAGTLRCTRGPPWTSATARGSGGGTSELERIGGLWLNANAITNGPATRRGTYVGTIATLPGAATVSMHYAPAAASGGSDNFLGVWNAFNRRQVAALMRDSDNTWAYTLAAWRPWNNDSGGAGTNIKNRVTFVSGLQEGRIAANFISTAANSTANIERYGGIGLDSTSAYSGLPGSATGASNFYAQALAQVRSPTPLGRHYVQALEYSVASGAATWRGDGGGSSIIQCGMTLEMEM